MMMTEYLYAELVKRNIPAIIMEPLLGGRLSSVPDNIVARLKQREPQRSVASWAFRFAGSFPGVMTVLSGMKVMEHLQDNLRTYAPLQPLTDEEFDFLQQTATLWCSTGPSLATIANIVCLAPMGWTFRRFCCTTTSV